MESTIHIAVDCMSGDCGPHSNLKGVVTILQRYSHVHLHLCGNKSNILSAIPSSLMSRVTVHSSEYVIASDLKPSMILRMKEITSLHQAIDLVATKVAHIVVSSANTGAYMALSLKKIGLVPNLKRPAIGKIIPSLNEQSPISQTLLLDLGANVSCSAETLASFAILARNYLFKAHHLKTPKIGILNIGSEAGKGTEELQEAFNIISNLSDIDFIGFVEGDNLLNGIAHIIICDGFHGNIALKTLEGTIQTFYSLLKTTMRRPSSFRSKIGALLLKNEFKRTFEEIYNPKRYNGALFMGLNGNVIKSHGGADSESFAYAIRTAYEIAQSNYH